MTQQVRTESINLTQAQAYTKSALFIAANIALPYLFHLVPEGGKMFLPIYFFTLVAAIRYGWQVAALTAVMTPVVGNLLFGAPALHMLADMVVKGTVLSLLAGYAAMRLGKQLWVVAVSVLASWALVGLVEMPFTGAAFAFQDFVTGVPGMAMMTLGAWGINKILKK